MVREERGAGAVVHSAIALGGGHGVACEALEQCHAMAADATKGLAEEQEDPVAFAQRISVVATRQDEDSWREAAQ